MEVKFFSAESREAAEAMAEAHFKCDRKDLVLEDVNGGEDGKPWEGFAMTGTPSQINNTDAGFATYFEADGVYLEIFPERGAGNELEAAVLSKHLSRKNISGLNTSAVQSLIMERRGRAKIASAQQESIYGEDLVVDIPKDEMTARAWLLSPEPGGPLMELDAAVKKVREAGITNGIDEQALTRLLEAKDYGEPFVIAEATPPKDGSDGKLIFHFSTDGRTGRPREIGGGRVDYRSLDLYEPVVENQLLVTRTPATEGVPGATVTGRALKQKPGKEINLPKGKNVDVNEERTEIRAKCSGMVEFLNNSINVSSVYKINGDCDLSVGNIDFDGSVHISGNVRSGHVVKASGGITIGGAVEAATVIAGGNIEIKGGMQGADKGRIESGGSISILFIERGTAVADGSINVDVSIHSNLEAGGSIIASGRRGAIIGGQAGAAGDIVANFLGAISQPLTYIEVGVTPRKRVRIQNLEKEIERIKNETVKLDQLDVYLKNGKEKLDPETWDKLFRSGAENRRVNEQSLEEYKTEIEDLKYELEHATESKVHVLETAFDGTKITIGNGIYKINTEIQFATFRYKDAEVIYGPCERSKAKE